MYFPNRCWRRFRHKLAFEDLLACGSGSSKSVSLAAARKYCHLLEWRPGEDGATEGALLALRMEVARAVRDCAAFRRDLRSLVRAARRPVLRLTYSKTLIRSVSQK